MPATAANVPLPAALGEHGLEIAVLHTIGATHNSGSVEGSVVHEANLIQGRKRRASAKMRQGPGLHLWLSGILPDWISRRLTLEFQRAWGSRSES